MTSAHTVWCINKLYAYTYLFIYRAQIRVPFYKYSELADQDKIFF